MTKKYAYALAGLLLAGCSGDFVKLGAGQQLGEFHGTFTLQGKIMDARTGAALSGDDLKLKLIQGTEIRDPSRLVTTANDPLAGEYAFSGIPLTTQDQAYYKIVAMKGGYIQFESVLDSFGATYDNNFPLMDTVYNFVGNIYMQPVGAAAPSITVNVDYNGKAVPGATVYLDPSSTTWNNGTDQTYILSPSYGYNAAISASTGADGKAVFDGGSLGLGVVYTIRVNPITFEGVALVQPTTTGSTVAVGVVGSQTELYIALADAVPGGNQWGLYITDASNRYGGIDANGVLRVTFNRAIALTGDLNTKFIATINYGALQPFPAPTTLATLSGDGLTLTLTPNWATPPNSTTDRGAWVQYSGNVSVAGYPGSNVNLFGLSQSWGGLLSNQVMCTYSN